MIKRKILIMGLIVLSLFWFKEYIGHAYSINSIRDCSPEEIRLYASHPMEAIKARDAAHIAEEYAESCYAKYTLSEGNGDACRHALWSALMTKRISRDFAYDAGLAHEGLTREYIFNFQDDSRKMDISNNYSGRILGTTYAYYSEDFIKRQVVLEVNRGNMKRIRVYSSGSGEHIRTRSVGYYVETSNGGCRYQTK